MKRRLLGGRNTVKTTRQEEVWGNGNCDPRRAEFLWESVGISPGWKSLRDVVQFLTEEFNNTSSSQVWTIVIKTNSPASENTLNRCCSGYQRKRSCTSFWLSGLKGPWQSLLFCLEQSSSHNPLDVLMNN